VRHCPLKLNQEKFLRLLSILLFLISLTYLIKGFYLLILGDYSSTAKDLFLRWKEQQYIYQGQYPYDVIYGSPNVDPKIGLVNSGGYFPWSFFAQFLFIPKLPWRALRIYFALLDLISLLVLSRFAYQIGNPYGKSKAFFSVAACLAISSYSTTLYLGQYGIIINALLVGVFWCLKYKQQAWTGLLLGLAMTKLNIAAFYIFIPIALVRLNTLRVLLGYFVIANLSIWAITQINPVDMIYRVYEQSRSFASRGKSVTSLLVNSGMNAQLVTIASGLIGLCVVIAIFYFWRKCSLLALFATASVLGRVALYHWHYDNLMLVFLLLFLIQMTLSNTNKFNLIALTLTITTLSIPAKLIELPLVQNSQIFIWLAVLAYALIEEKKKQNLASSMLLD
jgi:hypothetical protein